MTSVHPRPLKGPAGRAAAILLILVMSVSALVSACYARAAPEQLSLTSDQWRKDLAFVAAELPRRHKNAFHHISQQDFARAVADLDARIPNLQGHEVAVGMLRLGAMIGDIHTRLQIPAAFQRYPLQVEWFGEELRITGASEPYRAALGGRILAIGDVGIDEVQRRVRPLAPQAENDWTFPAVSPSLIVRPEILHALAIVPNTGPAAFKIANDAGETVTLTVAPVPGEPAPQLVQLGPPLPLYRQRPEQGFWFEWLPEQQAVYVNFRKYDDFADHARQLFSFIDEHPAHRLIIDMRNNTGGDFTKVREQLIPGLKRRPGAYANGNLFVVIGRRTLSAAMTNAIDLKNELGAVLVGEPSGERPNSYQERREMQLPNSGLTFNFSTKYYQFLPDDRPALLPDRPIPVTWADYRAGKDPVVEAINR